jgi:Helix-turn-helix domain
MDQDDKPWTLRVPDAGKKYFGLSRQGSYDAVRRGEIPVVRIGRLLRVPVRKLEEQLAGKDA